MLIDGLTLLDTSTVVNLTIGSGPSFPTATLGELFYKTGADDGLYFYNGTTWVPTSDTVDISTKLSLSGGTMTGSIVIPTGQKISLADSPLIATDAANKGYVDAVAQGLNVKPAVKVATTANLTATYNNGTLGVGATLTATTNGAFPTVDGVTLVAYGDGILVKNQTNAAQNGRYYLSQVGSGSTPWILTRCSYCDEKSEIPAAFVFVNGGTSQSGTGWVQTVANPDTFTVGTDAITVTQFSSTGAATLGAGYIGYGSGASTLTGSPNFIFNSSTTQLNVGSAYITGSAADGGTNAIGTSTGVSLIISPGSASGNTGVNLSILGSGIGQRSLAVVGGPISITAGQGSDTTNVTNTQAGVGGPITVAGGQGGSAGSGGGSGAGGTVTISGGTGGWSNFNAPGAGGNVVIAGGVAGGPLGSGGAIVFTTAPANTSTERFRITKTGAWSIGTNGTSYGSTGQVLTSNGDAAPTWQTISVPPSFNGGTISSALTITSVSPQLVLGSASGASVVNAQINSASNTSGSGSSLTINAGSSNGSGGNGGNVSISAGQANGSGAAGTVTITGGAAAGGSALAGGSVTIIAGAGGNLSAGVTIAGGTVTDNGTAGSVTVRGGDVSGTNTTGGSVTVRGGTGSTGAGSVVISTGSSSTPGSATARITVSGVDGTSTFASAVRQKYNNIAASAIDLALGNFFDKTISGATTFTVTNVPASGTAASFILELTNGGSAAITWWSGMKWAGGTAPTLTAAGRDVLGFFTRDGGTTWTGLLLGKDVK